MDEILINMQSLFDNDTFSHIKITNVFKEAYDSILPNSGLGVFDVDAIGIELFFNDKDIEKACAYASNNFRSLGIEGYKCLLENIFIDHWNSPDRSNDNILRQRILDGLPQYKNNDKMLPIIISDTSNMEISECHSMRYYAFFLNFSSLDFPFDFQVNLQSRNTDIVHPIIQNLIIKTFFVIARHIKKHINEGARYLDLIHYFNINTMTKKIKFEVYDSFQSDILNSRNILNELSDLSYEGDESYAKVVFLDRSDIDNLEALNPFVLDPPIEVVPENKRQLRKLIQVAGNQYTLLCNFRKGLSAFKSLNTRYLFSSSVYALLHNDYIKFQNAIYAEFHGKSKWTMNLGIYCLFKYAKDEIYILPNLNTSKAISSLRNWVKSDIGALTEIVTTAALQSKGTMLVIGKNAISIQDEAKRLAKYNRAFLAEKPIKLTGLRTLLNSITSIDGAVFVDTECNCYAIGVILDGKASEFGDAGRGARFNSAVSYVNGSEANCEFSAIVFSEDGDVEFIEPK